MASLSKTCDEAPELWRSLDAVRSLFHVARLKEACRREAYVAIVNIVDESDMHTHAQAMNDIKALFVDELRQCCQQLNSGKFLQVLSVIKKSYMVLKK